MKLHENIQQLRRQAGLSQEALAEKLGVSRQAVSKWESGAALPELEKLTEMARLFSVRLDALLGLTPPEDSPPSGAPAPFDEESLRRLLSASEAQTAAHDKRLLTALGLGMAALLTAVCLFVSFQLSSLRQEYQNSLSSLRGSLTDLESRFYAALQQPQDTDAASFLDVDCRVSALDPLEKHMTLWLSATPYEYQEGATARFVLSGDGFEPLSVDGTRDAGGAFTAEGRLPLCDEVDIRLVLRTPDGLERTEKLDRLSGLLSLSQLQVFARFDGSYTRFNLEKAVTFHISPRATLTAEGAELYQKWGLSPLVPVSGRAELTHNGKVLDSVPLEFSAEQPLDDPPSSVSAAAALAPGFRFTATGGAIERKCALEPGDRFALTLYISDSYGQQYEQAALSLSIGADGEFREDAPRAGG